MRMSKLVAKTTKENPRDAEIPSHIFMLRAGFMRQYCSGIYGLLPLAMRCVSKIEKICRQEMNGIFGQEIRLPCSATKELWDETGRYDTFGNDMFKFQDRNDKKMVLNPTHEEPLVSLIRNEVTSYKQLPIMLYQIQTKFRDEPRPRGGLIRLREFTMKDAYSFHTSEKDLKQYYDQMYDAYNRFFKRCGCKNFVSVMSDNGLFGGKYSHEFQMLVPTGEDKLITCPSCKYSANEEVARAAFTTISNSELPLTKTSTPNIKTISELSLFLKSPTTEIAKAVIYQTLIKKTPVICFVRGDLQVIDAKIRTLIGEEIVPASPEAFSKCGAIAGSTGPLNLNIRNCIVVFDPTVSNSSNLTIGANEDNFHYINFNLNRDLIEKLDESSRNKIIYGDIAAAKSQDPCPHCNTPLEETRGIEIGNIFHLGTKYSKSMNCTVLEQNGKAINPIMGCYGIGITRLLPAIIEESHDERGPILPLPIAPFEIHFCVLNKKDQKVTEISEKIYAEFLKENIEILIDDRDEKPGSQFADADLMGIPFRIIISPKTLAENCVEFKYRDNRTEPQKIKLENILAFSQEIIRQEYHKYS